MTGSRKRSSRQGWPVGLYETNGYYYWRHPLSRKNYGLGRNLATAKAQACEAAISAGEEKKLAKARLIDRVTGNDERTVSALLVRYINDVAKKNLATNTLRTKTSMITRIEARWGALPYSSLTTIVIDQFLQEFIAADKLRMAASFRSFLGELGDKAIAVGWAQHNPAKVTEAVQVRVKRERLTLETFLTIYDAAGKECDRYMQPAMRLAFVTAQRREDISLWTRDDVRDGALWVEQGKSENTEARGEGVQTRLALPLSLTISATTQDGTRSIAWSLKDAIADCWSDRVASRYLIHHSRNRTTSKPGDRVWRDTISKGFSRARDATGLTWKGSPPTFHEIRSLSIRYWKELHGKDFAQAIAGHKQASTTDVYNDARGNWVMLKTA